MMKTDSSYCKTNGEMNKKEHLATEINYFRVNDFKSFLHEPGGRRQFSLSPTSGKFHITQKIMLRARAMSNEVSNWAKECFVYQNQDIHNNSRKKNVMYEQYFTLESQDGSLSTEHYEKLFGPLTTYWHFLAEIISTFRSPSSPYSQTNSNDHSLSRSISAQ